VPVRGFTYAARRAYGHMADGTGGEGGYQLETRRTWAIHRQLADRNWVVAGICPVHTAYIRYPIFLGWPTTSMGCSIPFVASLLFWPCGDGWRQPGGRAGIAVESADESLSHGGQRSRD